MTHKRYHFLLILFLILAASRISYSRDRHYIVVAKDGSGDFKTITEAVNSLPMFNYERVVIFIKNGVYKEKIRITQDYVTLRGESKDSTIIEYSQLRTDWIADKDEIGPAVINIHADDIVLENLTIRNTQPLIGPHAFAVYGTGTRTILLNCKVLSKGGDTISLWNYKSGMYYHANCTFEGSVDFVCPRGWCFIKNSKFYEHEKIASLWHAGGYNINQKFVLENCSFDGVKGFQLGRHHYDAQFYLLNCKFSSNLADTPIYRVVYKADPSKNRPDNWGERDYYYNCQRAGGDYKWFKNNLETAAGYPKVNEITPAWTFDGKWDPESTRGPNITKYEIHNGYVLLFFTEPITVIGNPLIKSSTGAIFSYVNGAGSDTIRFNADRKFSSKDLSGLLIINSGKLLGTRASVNNRPANLLNKGTSKN